MKEGKKVLVRQTRGTNGRTERTKETLRALGLGRVGKQREHVLNPCIAGMVRRVRHLVRVTPAE